MKSIIVWERTGTAAVPIKIIDDYISYQYQKGFNATGDFLLTLPANVDYLDAVSRTNARDKIIQFDPEYFGIVYQISFSQDQGKRKLVVKGRHLTSLIGHFMRGRPGITGGKLKVHSTDVATDIEYFWNLARSDSPVHTFIANHYLDDDVFYPVTQEITFNKTPWVGKWTSTGFFDSSWINWLEYLEEMGARKDFGFDLQIDNTGYMPLTLCEPITHDETDILISTEFGNISNSTYSINSESYYTHACSSGKSETQGFQEYYSAQGEYPNMDASQCRMYGMNVDCENISSSLGEFLNFQCQGFLTNHRMVKTYEANFNLLSLEKKLGVDYNLGDYIYVWDSLLDVSVRAQLSAYTRTVTSDGETIAPTFGFDQIGLRKLLKRNGVI